MIEVLAIVAVAVYVLVAMVKIELVTLLVAPGPLMESIVEVPAPACQSNYVSGCQKEESHCYDYHWHFLVAVSNRYYSLIILNRNLIFYH